MNMNINSNLSACVGDNSEMIKVVNLAFFNIRNFLFETFMPNLVTLTCPSLQIMDKTQTGVFSISGYLVKSFTNKNYRNYRNSPEIDMKRGPLTWKKYDNVTKNWGDVVSKNYEIIVIFLIYGQFGGIQKPDSRHMVHEILIYINNNLLSNKNWKRS